MKHLKREVLLQCIFFFLLVLNYYKVSFTLLPLLIYAPVLSTLYFFRFHYWVKDEASVFFKLTGRFAMFLLPVAMMFSANRFLAAEIVVPLCLGFACFYWVLRVYRKTFFQSTSQKILLLILWTLPGILFFL